MTTPRKCPGCQRPLVTQRPWERMTPEQRAGKAAHGARGMCRPCYNKSRSRTRPKCAVPDCGKPRFTREWCARHYQRWRRTGSTEGGWEPKPSPLDPEMLARLRRQVGLPVTGPTPTRAKAWYAKEKESAGVAS
jgi:hypothetical protein